MTILIAITVLMVTISVSLWLIVLLKKFQMWAAIPKGDWQGLVKRALLELGAMALGLLIYAGLAWVVIEVVF